MIKTTNYRNFHLRAILAIVVSLTCTERIAALQSQAADTGLFLDHTLALQGTAANPVRSREYYCPLANHTDQISSGPYANGRCSGNLKLRLADSSFPDAGLRPDTVRLAWERENLARPEADVPVNLVRRGASIAARWAAREPPNGRLSQRPKLTVLSWTPALPAAT